MDIVIDTCTLKHANDPKSKYFEHSVDFINRMHVNNVSCTVDEGFSMNEGENKSYIGLEFIKHLQPGTLGYGLVTYLASNLRIDFVSNKVPNGVKKFIEKTIRNKKDRMFLRVAYNATEKRLASHDFTDYQKRKRKTIRMKLNVSIVTAEEINPLL